MLHRFTAFFVETTLAFRPMRNYTSAEIYIPIGRNAITFRPMEQRLLVIRCSNILPQAIKYHGKVLPL